MTSVIDIGTYMGRNHTERQNVQRFFPPGCSQFHQTCA